MDREVRSSRLTLSTGQFYHVAITWNKGVVTFFMDGLVLNSRTVPGTVYLFDSSAPLRLGANETATDHLDGVLDEVRLSQVIRYAASGTNTYTIPNAPHSTVGEN